MAINPVAAGLSGVMAAEAELQTAESNIANANDPNYSLESVPLSPMAGSNGEGIGVDAGGVQRASAPFVTAAINQDQSNAEFNNAYVQVTQALETYLGSSSGQDMAQALQQMFNAFGELAASPEDTNARQQVLDTAGQFADITQQVSAEFSQAAQDAFASLSSLVGQVNEATAQIADLNQQIQTAQASGSGAAALLDQRDALVGQLAQLVGATADADGNVSLNGLPLVVGTEAFALQVTGSGASTGLEVVLPFGTTAVPSDDLSGQIGGTFAGAERVLQLQNDLMNFAGSVAQTINAKQSAGYGLDGSTGLALFTIPSPGGAVYLNSAVGAGQVAAASSAAGVPGDGSNAAAISALAQAAGLGGASFANATAAQAYGEIVDGFGSAVQSATSAAQQATASVQSLQSLKGSITGVNVNEELTMVAQYQNTLEAAGRAIQAANDTTAFLLNELQ
jgi:flagellar hook-associated protein 1